MYKMIVFDIDGTLLKFQENTLRSEINDLFARLKNKGYCVVLATGRDFVSIGDIYKDPNVDYFIGANGSFIYDLKKEKYLFNSSIEFSEFKRYYKEFLLTNQQDVFNVVLSDDENVYVWDKQHLDGHWFWEPFRDKFKPFEDAEKSIKKDKFHLVTINCMKERPIIKDSQHYFATEKTNIDVQAWWPNGFFVANKGIHKGSTITKLCQMLNIDLKQVMAFGDGENDITMLKTVGLGVAMGNANDLVKSVAKEVTTSVEEFGTIAFLEKNGLI